MKPAQLGAFLLCLAVAGVCLYFLPPVYQLAVIVGFPVFALSNRARSALGIGALLFEGLVYFVLYHALRICGFNLVPTKFFKRR
ncbi:MAG TPA: hypothetical protein VFW53_09095 [Gallionella sp.]|nr:hypothetical protein [Gallionella sp.]